MAKQGGIKESILLRVRIVFGLVVLVSLAVVLKIFWIQWVEGDKWREIAKQNQVEYRIIKADRGNIYAEDGSSLLATSLPFYKVAFDPTVASDEVFKAGIDSLSYLMARYFGNHTALDYKRQFSDYRKANRRYLRLSNDMINHQLIKKMKTWPIFRLGQMRGGLITEKVEKRFMPFDALARRTIGSITQDNYGLAGMEFSFNRHLAGTDGESIYKKTSGGRWIPVNDGTYIASEKGFDVYSTIDINLQDVAESALRNALYRNRAENGCVILMEVATGEIKAMANLGSNGEGQYIENYNYGVARRIEPGSTFKLASYMALLEENALPDSIDTGEGEFKFYDEAIMRDVKPGGYGKISTRQAFAYSSNIAVARLITEHFKENPKKFINYLIRFGLSQPLNFQLKGTALPYIRTPDDPKWSGLSLPWLSIGYESAFAPLQILAFYNAVANNGRMIQPILVKEIRKANKVIERYEPEVISEKICSDRTIDILRSYLTDVVRYGTARNIRNDDYEIAGKTGTAQKIKDGKYTRTYYTSFAGFFPAHKPKYSCIVAIDNPKGYQQYGSDVAAPVFKELADKIYSGNIELHDAVELARNDEPGIFPVLQSGNYYDLNLICNELGISNHTTGATQEWVKARPVNNSISWKAKEIQTDRMPDVRGMTLRDALYLLENQGLQVKYSGKGRVESQWPTPDEKVKAGNKVVVTLN